MARIAITLRSQPVPPIQKPRKSRARWNAQTQKLDYPPTKRQVLYLAELCKQLDVTYTRPKTKDEAKSLIGKLVHERRVRSRKVRRDRKRDISRPWKFGEGQTLAEERLEMQLAAKHGRLQEYVNQQSARRAR
jgi:hypothetical protein